MKIRMTVKKIHYGDVAVKAIPALLARMHSESAVAHIFTALARLSEQTIYQIFDEIPQQDKNQIVSLLCRENHDRILTMGNRLLEENGIPLVLNSIQLDDQLNVCVEVGKNDYAGLVRAFIPMIQANRTSGSDAAAPLLQRLSADNEDVLLRFIPQSSKDRIAVYLLNANQERLCSLAKRMAEEHGLRLSVDNLSAVA